MASAFLSRLVTAALDSGSLLQQDACRVFFFFLTVHMRVHRVPAVRGIEPCALAPASVKIYPWRLKQVFTANACSAKAQDTCQHAQRAGAPPSFSSKDHRGMRLMHCRRCLQMQSHERGAENKREEATPGTNRTRAFLEC